MIISDTDLEQEGLAWILQRNSVSMREHRKYWNI